MEDSAAAADRSPRCTYLGCSRPATYGVERAYMSPMVYCIDHMEDIARRKSSARTLHRVFKLAEPATCRRGALTRVGARISPQPSSAMLSSAGVIASIWP